VNTSAVRLSSLVGSTSDTKRADRFCANSSAAERGCGEAMNQVSVLFEPTAHDDTTKFRYYLVRRLRNARTDEQPNERVTLTFPDLTFAAGPRKVALIKRFNYGSCPGAVGLGSVVESFHERAPT
jgi:hypothetical protein